MLLQGFTAFTVDMTESTSKLVGQEIRQVFTELLLFKQRLRRNTVACQVVVWQKDVHEKEE